MTRLIAAALVLATYAPATAQTARTVPTYTNQAGTEVPAQGVFSVGWATYQTETTTVLGASAVFTGPARAVGPAPQANSPSWSRHAHFVAEAWSDQAGTLYVEKSTTGGQTWVPVNGSAGTAVAAGATVTVVSRVSAYQYRVRYVNGGAAQGGFALTTALSN